jgi:hypothetical protein
MVVFRGRLGYVADPDLLSILQNQVFGSCGQKSQILKATWATCCSLSSFFAAILFTKECGLEVDCNLVQERVYAKAGSTLCRSTCLVLYSKACTCVLITCRDTWPREKLNAGSPDVERCKHIKSQATTVYFRQGKLGPVFTYVHMCQVK